MRQSWTSVDDLAEDLKAVMGAGDRREFDLAIWNKLTFDDRRYEAHFQALEVRLGDGWDVTVDQHHAVVYRHNVRAA
jgi:hypothetical protein